MERIIYFGEYSLSEQSEIKLRNNENLLLKHNSRHPNSAWNSLFKVEEQELMHEDEKNISMEIDEKESSQNMHQESIAMSQFVITQIETTKKNIIVSEVMHHEDASELLNIAESIYEILEDANRTLDPNDLKNLNHCDVDEVMERLSQLLSLNGTYNLCNSLCCMEIDVAMQYVKAICTKILLQRIIELDKPQQATKMISIVVDKMAKKFPEDIHNCIFIPIINADLKDTTVPLTIIKCYVGHNKMALISDFLLTARELKQWHTIILISLIDMKIDDNMTDRLLKLLVERSLALSRDKIYSKFVLSFIKLNSPFTDMQKRMLDEIVSVNDTIFKTSMKQILQNM